MMRLVVVVVMVIFTIVSAGSSPHLCWAVVTGQLRSGEAGELSSWPPSCPPRCLYNLPSTTSQPDQLRLLGLEGKEDFSQIESQLIFFSCSRIQHHIEYLEDAWPRQEDLRTRP